MKIECEKTMPEGTFTIMTESGPDQISTDELFKNKTVVLVCVPGAYTPTCSVHHLPGYIESTEQFFSKGVNTIAFMAVNDIFVMNAWGNDQGVGDKVMMLSDGNGEYVEKLGLEMDARNFGMGTRGQRFAIVIKNGIVKHIAVEEPGEFNVTKATSVLESI